MELFNYFRDTQGTGILATSDSEGNVDIAVYSKPYVMTEKIVALHMLNRKSYANIRSNPNAAYMFVENSKGYKGKRLYLIKIDEQSDPDRVKKLKREHPKIFKPDMVNKHLVYFLIKKSRPLVGS